MNGDKFGGLILAGGIIGGVAAIGASIAKRPVLGAAVGVGVPVGLVTLASAMWASGPSGKAFLLAGAHTGLLAGGAALGAAAGGRHPSTGAFIGAATTLGLEVLALEAMAVPASSTEKQVGTSGPPSLIRAMLAPRAGMHLGAVGGFP